MTVRGWDRGSAQPRSQPLAATAIVVGCRERGTSGTQGRSPGLFSLKFYAICYPAKADGFSACCFAWPKNKELIGGVRQNNRPWPQAFPQINPPPAPSPSEVFPRPSPTPERILPENERERLQRSVQPCRLCSTTVRHGRQRPVSARLGPLPPAPAGCSQAAARGRSGKVRCCVYNAFLDKIPLNSWVSTWCGSTNTFKYIQIYLHIKKYIVDK